MKIAGVLVVVVEAEGGGNGDNSGGINTRQQKNNQGQELQTRRMDTFEIGRAHV